jgi:very-short-patch-repair endonuclease
MSTLSNFFWYMLVSAELNHTFKQEYKFHPKRKWRFDFADPANKIAVEIDGGVFAGGRHTRGMGFKRDCEKINAATVLGWRVLRYVDMPSMRQFGADYQALLDGDKEAA